MTDQRDDRRDQRDADDVVADQSHQLADDDVKHPGIVHDAEIQHGEHEQGSRGRGAVEAGLDHGRKVVKAVAPAQHHDQSQRRRENDEGDGRLRPALEQCDDDSDDADETEDADEHVTHTLNSFQTIRCA